MSDWVEVAGVEEIPPGEWMVADVDDVEVAVFNLDGQFYAIENICTHDYSELTGGCVEDGQIVCPRHGARFCIRTGAALTPPAYEPVPTLEVEVSDGRVRVRDTRWD